MFNGRIFFFFLLGIFIGYTIGLRQAHQASSDISARSKNPEPAYTSETTVTSAR